MRQRRRLIVLAAAGVALIGAGVIVAGLVSPVRTEASSSLPSARKSSDGETLDRSDATAAQEAARKELMSLQQLTSQPLRGPLFDPPSVNTGGQPQAMPLTVQLIGLVYEPPDRSVAVFQQSNGAKALCFVGESVDDVGGKVTVTGIAPDKVTVQYREVTHVLTPPPKQ